MIYSNASFSACVPNVKKNIFFAFGQYLAPNRRRTAVSRATVFYVDEINERLKMRKPLQIQYDLNDGYFSVHHVAGKLTIDVVEDTYASMVQEFKNEISDYWYYLAKEDDVNLSDGAKSAKIWLLKNVKEIGHGND